jgi:hypothetical protein
MLAWVGVRAMYIAVWIEGPVMPDPQSMEEELTAEEKPIDTKSTDVSVQELFRAIRRVNERRHQLFGYYEAIYVGIGTMLVALGCVIYFIGLINEV